MSLYPGRFTPHSEKEFDASNFSSPLIDSPKPHPSYLVSIIESTEQLESHDTKFLPLAEGLGRSTASPAFQSVI
jgi:hypothetical protein